MTPSIETQPMTKPPMPPDQRHLGWRDAPDGPWVRLNWLLAQYRVIVIPAVAFLFWVGMQNTGPGARVAAVEVRVGSLERGMARLIASNEAIARLQCFNASFTREQRELAGLDCEAVLRGEYVRTPR